MLHIILLCISLWNLFFLFFTNSLVQKKSNAEEIYKNISLKKKIKLCSKLVEHQNFDHIFSEPLEV